METDLDKMMIEKMGAITVSKVQYSKRYYNKNNLMCCFMISLRMELGKIIS